MKNVKLFLLVLVMAMALTVFTACTETKTVEETTTTTNEVTENEQMVEVAINNGEEEKTYEFNYEEGLTAYDYLMKATEKDNTELKTTEYDFGISIDGIGTMIGGTDGKYWMYYIDGQSASVAADKQEVSAGAVIEFKYEASEL
jgi:hypothetical protein